MTLRLIGHYDSPFVRRVGVSLHVLGLAFERQPLSVFRHLDEVSRYNPLGRVPVLVLADGEVLSESGAILDHLDAVAGPERALLPAAGTARREALQLIALATGVADKCIAIAYERRRSPDKIDAAWVGRCRDQVDRGLLALETRVAAAEPAPEGRLLQPLITIAAVLGYLRLREPDALPAGRHPGLETLSRAAEAAPAFQACLPAPAEIGGEPEAAARALLRLQGLAPSA